MRAMFGRLVAEVLGLEAAVILAGLYIVEAVVVLVVALTFRSW